MKNVKVTIDYNSKDETAVTIKGKSDMKENIYSQIDVIVGENTIIKTTINNIEIIPKGIELENSIDSSEELNYHVSGELDGSIAVQFDDYEFNGIIRHTSQKEVDTERYISEDIRTNHPFYDIIKERAIKDFKELYNKSKKAYLVEYSIRTRVIVPTPDEDLTEEKLLDLVNNVARRKIRENIKDDNGYPYEENIVEIKQDTEVPYDPISDSL